MRALAYLLGARALDVAREADGGIRPPKSDDGREPMATTQATAAAWRRWRERGDLEASRDANERGPSLIPKRA
jgi:hypothetical protein